MYYWGVALTTFRMGPSETPASLLRVCFFQRVVANLISNRDLSLDARFFHRQDQWCDQQLVLGRSNTFNCDSRIHAQRHGGRLFRVDIRRCFSCVVPLTITWKHLLWRSASYYFSILFYNALDPMIKNISIFVHSYNPCGNQFPLLLLVPRKVKRVFAVPLVPKQASTGHKKPMLSSWRL